ncbi:hypothetical protein ILUMI_26622 [Ignelater luminosus]|uniref:Uncharacterized protein n=1 Tax=Ignelater luminosus TaxID=2038154 RepID=A0A8K0FYR4_IGNLU|nr:hypothetical protein ILUMI_26622 [Ignelater luminosus]
MAKIMEIMQLCRLCLVKDQVNIPIFEEQGDIRQIFLKISACLPVKVSREDNLPKKICDGCSYKLEMLYQFWNTSANSEKQLLKWLSQVGIDKVPTSDKKATAQPQSHSINTDGVILKQEVIDLGETHADEEITTDELNVPTDPEYLLQQQSYQSFEFQQDGFNEGEAATSGTAGPSSTVTSESAAAPKRKRRAAAMKPLPPQIDSEDEDDVGLAETKIAKTEEQSDDSAGEDPEPTTFVGLPADNEQPGPSGVGKATTGSDAPNMRRRNRNSQPLASINALLATKENLSNRLPEIDIIPVGLKSESQGYTLPELFYVDKKEDTKKSVPKKKAAKKTKRTLADMGYKNPFVYTNCNYTSKQRESKQHETSNNKWTCMICNEVTANKESLIEHYEKHKNEKEGRIEQQNTTQNIEDYFKCVVCTREFTSSRSYEKHLELKHGENRYACEQCNKTYKNSFQLCLHNFSAHPDDGKYKCIACDFTTVNRASLRSHIEKHENDYRFQCEICDKKFLRSSWFEEHKNSHTGAMPFQCEVCTKSFPYSRYLVAHKKSVHPQIYSDTPAINQCEICSKQFAHKKSLIVHIRSHTGENTVLCDMCGKSLSSTEHLKQHLRIHTGYKPHVCSICGKGFAKKSNLTLHERVHSGEKPYICRNCGKSFSQRSTLVIHERYHSGERPYTCPLCNKGFVAKGLLGVHLKSCSRIPQ